MHTLKDLYDFDITQKFNAINNLLYQGSEKYKQDFFDKIANHVIEEQENYSLPLKIQVVNELNALLSLSDEDIAHATVVFRHINQPERTKRQSESGHFKNTREFWNFISEIFANDPQIKELIRWENPGIDQPQLKPTATENERAPLIKNDYGEITFLFIPEKFSRNDIIDMFPCLRSFGAGEFGEDADMFGDTLEEVIKDAPKGYDLILNQKTIRELRTLLSYTDKEIDLASRALIRISPTEEVEEPPNWGRFPTLRAFWTAVLESFENNVTAQEAESAGHSSSDVIESTEPDCRATNPVPIVQKTLSGMTYYLHTNKRS
jgi:hypothetical protein